MGIGWAGGRYLRSECPGERHDEMAAGHQRLLVGRGDDLAGPQRSHDRSKADHAARADDDEVDIVAADQRLEGVRAADPFGAGRQVQAAQRGVVGEGHGFGSEARHLLGEQPGVGTGRERHDLKGVRMRLEDIDGLPADGAGRAEEGDPAP